MRRDWTPVKADYVTGTLTYRELADKYGIPPSSLMREAVKDGWRAAREQHRKNLVKETVQKSQKDKAKKLNKVRDAVDIIAQRIAKIVEDEQQFHRHVVQVGLGDGKYETREVILQAVNGRALRDVVAALKDITATIRTLYGILTPQEQETLDIARARLRLEERKQLGGTDGEPQGVIVLPGAEMEEDQGAEDPAGDNSGHE